MQKCVKRNEVKVITRFSEALKRKVAEEIESGILSTRDAMRSYGIRHRKTVNRWVSQYGSNVYQTKIVRVEMKSEREEIDELKAALADERLRTRILAAQLESYQGYVPDFKKKLSTKDLKKFEENQRKIENFR